MNVRFTLRSPDGATVQRTVVDGRWEEPGGSRQEQFGEDLFALPGLVDAHAHLATAELNFKPGVLDGALERTREALTAGVTLIIDKGWSDTTTMEVIASLDRAERPEIEAAGRIIASHDGYYPHFGREVDGSELVDTVAAEARSGAGWVKLIGDWPRRGIGPLANFTEAELSAAVTEAAQHGARVAIHTMAHEVPSAAVRAGVHSIEHGLFLTEDDVALLGNRSGMWVPTVLRSEITLGQLGAESTGGKLFREGLDNIKDLIPLAVEAGVHVLAGTDLVGSPADVADEAIALSRYGLSNAQVLDSVSSAAFIATGRSASFELGSEANAVFFRSNPIEDLEVLKHPAAVLRMGRLQ